MKKVFSLILTLALCLSLCACFGGAEPTEPAAPSIEDVYTQLIEYAKSGQYLEAWRLCQKNRDVLAYQDAQAYSDYCDAMRAYDAGGIGFAYDKLKNIPHILNAQNTIDKIKERVGGLNGYYIADNGRGSYLHLVIRDGLVASQVIGYTAENQTFDYNAEDVYWQELVISTYTTGEEFVAIGRYSSLGTKIDKIDYVLEIFDDSPELMVTKYEGAEFNTLNGVYTKVAELETAQAN